MLKDVAIAGCHSAINTTKDTFKKQHPPMKKLFFTWKEVVSLLASKSSRAISPRA
jgi:hypothetical protein